LPSLCSLGDLLTVAGGLVVALVVALCLSGRSWLCAGCIGIALLLTVAGESVEIFINFLLSYLLLLSGLAILSKIIL
jgi:hypothetical protein